MRLAGIVVCLLALTSCGCKKGGSKKTVEKKPDQTAAKDRSEAKKKTPVAATDGKQQSDLVDASTSKVPPHPQTDDFTETQRNKDHTLFVIAFNSTTRQKYFMQNYPGLRPNQYEQMRHLIDSFDHEYRRIRAERAAILSQATDEQETKMLLQNVKTEILVTSRNVRRAIYRHILTKKQQEDLKRQNKDRREAFLKAREKSKYKQKKQ